MRRQVHCLRASVPLQVPTLLLLRSCSLLPLHPSWWTAFSFSSSISSVFLWLVSSGLIFFLSQHTNLLPSWLTLEKVIERLLKGSKLSDILKSHMSFSSPYQAKGKPAFQQDHPLPSPYSSLLPLPSPCLWPFSSVSGKSNKSHLVRTRLSPVCFPNYCLRKPETFLPMTRGDLFIPTTTPSLLPSPAGVILPHHIDTQVSQIANSGYRPLFGIYPLLRQEKKPTCPVTLQRHSYLQKNSLYQKAFLQYYLQPFRKAQISFTEQVTHTFTSIKDTALRTSGSVTLLVITQEHHSKVTTLLFFSL